MRSGILPGHRDESVRPQDDLFGFANGTWVRETQIPGDRGRYGTFDLLREQSDERVRSIIEQAAADTTAEPGSPARKVGDLYRSLHGHRAGRVARPHARRRGAPGDRCGDGSRRPLRPPRPAPARGPARRDRVLRRPGRQVTRGVRPLPHPVRPRDARRVLLPRRAPRSRAHGIPAPRGPHARAGRHRRRLHRRGLARGARRGAGDPPGRRPLGQRRDPRRGEELQPPHPRRARGARTARCPGQRGWRAWAPSRRSTGSWSGSRRSSRASRRPWRRSTSPTGGTGSPST